MGRWGLQAAEAFEAGELDAAGKEAEFDRVHALSSPPPAPPLGVSSVAPPAEAAAMRECLLGWLAERGVPAVAAGKPAADLEPSAAFPTPADVAAGHDVEAAAVAAAAAAAAVARELVVVAVGRSDQNSKTVALPGLGYVVSSAPHNLQGPGWPDLFEVQVVGALATVRRVDTSGAGRGGWGQPLQLIATPPQLFETPPLASHVQSAGAAPMGAVLDRMDVQAVLRALEAPDVVDLSSPSLWLDPPPNATPAKQRTAAAAIASFELLAAVLLGEYAERLPELLEMLVGAAEAAGLEEDEAEAAIQLAVQLGAGGSGSDGCAAGPTVELLLAQLAVPTPADFPSAAHFEGWLARRVAHLRAVTAAADGGSGEWTALVELGLEELMERRWPGWLPTGLAAAVRAAVTDAPLGVAAPAFCRQLHQDILGPAVVHAVAQAAANFDEAGWLLRAGYDEPMCTKIIQKLRESGLEELELLPELEALRDEGLLEEWYPRVARPLTSEDNWVRLDDNACAAAIAAQAFEQLQFVAAAVAPATQLLMVCIDLPHDIVSVALPHVVLIGAQRDRAQEAALLDHSRDSLSPTLVCGLGTCRSQANSEFSGVPSSRRQQPAARWIQCSGPCCSGWQPPSSMRPARSRPATRPRSRRACCCRSSGG